MMRLYVEHYELPVILAGFVLLGFIIGCAL